MPEEYVYKIVVDDSDVDKSIDSINSRMQDLANRMDASFRTVGTGAGRGIQEVARQSEQAAQRSGQAQVRASQQSQRADQQATQQALRGQQQVTQARRQSLAALERETRVAQERGLAALRASDEAKQALEEEQRALRELTTLQGQVSTRPGSPMAPIAAADVSVQQGRVSIAETQVTAADQELEASAEAYRQLVEQRDQARQEIEGISQQQGEATAQAARQSGQASVEASRQAAQAAREEVRDRRAILDQAENEVDAAKARLRAAKQAKDDQKAIYDEVAGKAKQAAADQKRTEGELKAARQEGNQSAIETLEKRLAKESEVAAQTGAIKDDEKAKLQTLSQAHINASNQATEAGDRRATASRRVGQAARQQSEEEGRLTQATRLQAKSQASTAAGSRTAEKQFVRIGKTYLKQRHELNELAKKHGSFTVTLGKSNSELNKHEKEVYDVINGNKQLREEVRKLTSEYGKFDVAVDRATFRGAPVLAGLTPTQVRQAGFAAQRIGVPGAAALGEAGAVAGPAGIAVAATLLATKELVETFFKVGKAAVGAFKNIVEGAADAAKEIEIARAQFGAFFQGDTQAAEAALGRLQKLSVELGENVVGVGRAFLPEVEDLDQLEEVVKIATGLARFQPEQGIQGARIALQEALGGEFRSLQRRFEISPIAIDKIRDAFQTSGVSGLLEELQAELERTGRSVEDLSDTFSVSSGRIKERIRQIQQSLGEPIIGAAKEQFNAIDEQLERLAPDLEVVATAFGEVVGVLVDMIGVEVESFLENFDPTVLLELAEAAYGVADAMRLVFEVLNPGALLAEGTQNALGGLGQMFINFEGWLISLGRSLNEFRTNFDAWYRTTLRKWRDIAEISNYVASPIGKPLRDAGLPIRGKDLIDIDAIDAALQSSIDSQDFEALDFDLLEEEHIQNAERFSIVMRDLGISIGGANEHAEESANAFMQIAQGFEGLTGLQEKYLESQTKVNEALKEFDIQAQLKFEKILTDAQRKRLDFEIESAQKLIDIANKNAEKIYDIRTKFDQDILDAAQDLTDKEADILRKHGDSTLDLEDERNKKRLEAEEKYLEALERLRDKFNFQAFEAILANDAKQLRQIRRRQAFEEGQLAKDRDKDLSSVDKDIDERKKKLDLALEREIRDARIANARKLRDLEENLQQQLDKQEVARKREIQAQATAEKRKREELKIAFDQQLEDYDTWWKERHRTTTEGIADDLEAMRGYAEAATGIINDLNNLGITFDPVTGKPIYNTQQPRITETQSPLMEELAANLLDLMRLEDTQAGNEPRTDEQYLEDIGGMSAYELVAHINRIQQSLQYGVGETRPEPIDIERLAAHLLTQQALFLGGQVGMSEDEILGELPESLADLQAWVDAFVNRYTFHELPDFTLFEDIAQGAQISMPGGRGGVFAEDPYSGYPGITPYTSPTGEVNYVPALGAVATGGYNPTALQNIYQPQHLTPGSPADPFDPSAYQQGLEEQVQAYVLAELQKRGEIEDTVAFAQLLAEKEALAVGAILGQETAAYQLASEEKIAILEDTLTRQKAALITLRKDPTLDDEAADVETAIGILEGSLERLRDEQIAAGQEVVVAGVAAVEKAETEKVTAIKDSADIQVGLIKLQEIDKAEEVALGREAAVEAEVEHGLEKAERMADEFDSELKLYDKHYDNFLKYSGSFYDHDIDLMQWWLLQRQALIEQSISQLPTLPGTPSLPGDPGASDSGPSLQELQNLALDLAQQLGLTDPDTHNEILTMSYNDLLDFIQYLQDQLGYALGGGFGQGPIIVGEGGHTELLSMGGAGRVDVFKDLLFRSTPPVSVGGNSYDNSTNLGGFNIPDPRGLPPTYVRQIENMISNAMIRAWGGRIV